MQTQQSYGSGGTLSTEIKNNWSSKIAHSSNENPPIYKLQLEEIWQNNTRFCRRRRFGRKVAKERKTIMMIGARGAGKTTLINSMINYILGVKWEDDFRFVLIDEGQQKSQAQYQTSEITAYQINYMDGFQVPYSLTIVDTPGFGDPRGLSDQKITAQIEELFTTCGGIDCIDAVCFVVQASVASLTATQKYVFDSIISMFGKDIAENIMVMATFADVKTPPVLEAIKKSQVPCSTDESGELIYFKFNNSAVFEANIKSVEDSDGENINKTLWKLGKSGMKKFFTSLPELKTRSLTLTRYVLDERKALEVLFQGLQPQIHIRLIKLDEIKKTKTAFEANEDVEVEVTVPKQIQNTNGYHLTNCKNCQVTCHDACIYANDRDKDKCWAMSGKNCKICPGKCVWNVHINDKNKWIYVKEKRKVSKQDFKKQYEAKGKLMSDKEIIEKLEHELEVVWNEVTALIVKSQESLRCLQEIALKPNPLSVTVYINKMIESEEQEAKPGFRDRIQSLKEIRDKADTISKIPRQ